MGRGYLDAFKDKNPTELDSGKPSSSSCSRHRAPGHTYLLVNNGGGGINGALVTMHHDQLRAALIQDLLHAAHTAALAACAHRHAGDGMVAAQTVHLPTQV